MAESYSLENYVQDLRRISGDTEDEDEIIRRVGPLTQQMALEKNWLQRHHYDCDTTQGFTAHLLHEEPDHTLAVFVVSWLPGRGAPPHDHGTWAVVAGVEGIENNLRYKRVDDRTRAGHAVLELKHALEAGEGDLICMKTGGIHAVRNDTERVTLSFHTYGKHINFTERSQFDLETNQMKDFKVLVQ